MVTWSPLFDHVEWLCNICATHTLSGLSNMNSFVNNCVYSKLTHSDRNVYLTVCLNWTFPGGSFLRRPNKWPSFCECDRYTIILSEANETGL